MDGGGCKSCGKPADYMHHDGGWVCEACVGSYFICPDCGYVFDRKDMVNGDAGNGFCRVCAPDH